MEAGIDMKAMKHSETRLITFEKVLTRTQQQQYADKLFRAEFGEHLINVRLLRSSFFDAEFEVNYIDRAYYKEVTGQHDFSERVAVAGWFMMIGLCLVGLLHGLLKMIF
jgi:hypothetical protein